MDLRLFALLVVSMAVGVSCGVFPEEAMAEEMKCLNCLKANVEDFESIAKCDSVQSASLRQICENSKKVKHLHISGILRKICFETCTVTGPAITDECSTCLTTNTQVDPELMKCFKLEPGLDQVCQSGLKVSTGSIAELVIGKCQESCMRDGDRDEDDGDDDDDDDKDDGDNTPTPQPEAMAF